VSKGRRSTAVSGRVRVMVVIEGRSLVVAKIGSP
jgi:hypothetical protein